MNEAHREFYDLKWDDASRRGELPIDARRASVILEMLERWCTRIRTDSRLQIVDVGCGVGWMSRLLGDYGDVLGIDASSAAIEIAKSSWTGGRFIRTDLLDSARVADLGVFDVAICSEVIEHIEFGSKPAFAETLASLVRPGGILVLTTPNRHAWRRYWERPESENWRQPVEDWCDIRSLRDLFRDEFEALEVFTYDYEFSRAGIYRILNSAKLNAALSSLGFQEMFDKFKSSKYGLYILSSFIRRGRVPE